MELQPLSAMSAPRQLWSDLAGERSRCPVTRHEDVNAVRVTSYAGVKEMLRDFRSFSNRFGTVDPGQELPVEDQILAFADPPRHSRQRKLLTAALSASRVEHLHEAMQQTVDGLIDAIIATGSPD
jgi:cytochrome P450